MAWLTGILQLAKYLFKIAGYFIDLRREKDKKKAEEKAEAGKALIDAFKEINPRCRDSAVVDAISGINRVRD